MNRKGIAVIDDLIALAIIGGILTAIVVIPFFFLKIHIVNVIEFENKYNTADLAMLALLSLYQNEKPVPQVLTEHYVFDNPSDIKFVNDTLDKIVPSKCYKLTTAEISPPTYAHLIKVVKDCQSDMSTRTKIPLPYNPQNLTQFLELSIS